MNDNSIVWYEALGKRVHHFFTHTIPLFLSDGKVILIYQLLLSVWHSLLVFFISFPICFPLLIMLLW